jgi:hypothetical protein
MPAETTAGVARKLRRDKLVESRREIGDRLADFMNGSSRWNV